MPLNERVVIFLLYVSLTLDINCDFGPKEDKTFCGWQQDTADVSDWTLRTGDTPTYFTGPKGDHTAEGPGPTDYGTGRL